MHTSVAGSMAYMAPQVVGRKGYSWQIDWWSLGITVYELLFHKRPFDGRSTERMTQSILKDPLRFPENARSNCSEAGFSALRGVSPFFSVHCIKSFSQFLDRDPSTRLGCRSNCQSIVDVRQHPWFSSINWDSLQTKESQPPFVPDVGPAFIRKRDIDIFLDERGQFRRVT